MPDPVADTQNHGAVLALRAGAMPKRVGTAPSAQAFREHAELLGGACGVTRAPDALTVDDVAAADELVIAQGAAGGAARLAPELLRAAKSVVVWSSLQASRGDAVAQLRADLDGLRAAGVATPYLWVTGVNALGALKVLAPRWMPYLATPTEAEALRALIATTPKRFDVGFVGRMTPRRTALLGKVVGLGASVLLVNCWGTARDAALASCRLLLSCHADDAHRASETLRYARWIPAGANMLLENGAPSAAEDDPVPNFTTTPAVAGFVVTAAYENLEARTKEILGALRGFDYKLAGTSPLDRNTPIGRGQQGSLWVTDSVAPPQERTSS